MSPRNNKSNTNNGNSANDKSPVRKNGFSPTWKKFNYSTGGVVQKFFNKKTIYVETFGNGAVVFDTEKTYKGQIQGGYLIHAYDVAKLGKPDINGISSELKLNLKNATFLYKRGSHEADDTVPVSSKLSMFRVVVVGFPNIDHYGEDDGEGGRVFTITSEEKMVRGLQHLISGRTGQNPANEFFPFSEVHSCTNFSKPKSLDTSITDYSVGSVLQTYILPNGSANSDAYNYLKENEETFFYSRKQSDGCFSEFAQNHFGYPSEPAVNASGEHVFW